MPFADVNGIRYSYSVSGKGEPVVLISGFGSGLGFWKRAAEILSPDFTVIAVDNRGSGLTEYSGRFTIGDMADDVAALLEHLGYDSAHIIGWSMGSHVAQNLAIRHPEKVRRLALISTYRYRPARTAYLFHAAMDAAEEGVPSEYIGRMMNGLGYAETYFRKKEIEGTPIKTAKYDCLEGLKDQFFAIDGHDTTETACRIKAPAMTVHGTEDIMVHHKEGAALSRLIEGCFHLEIEGAGHLIPSDFYIPAVAKFLKNQR